MIVSVDMWIKSYENEVISNWTQQNPIQAPLSPTA